MRFGQFLLASGLVALLGVGAASVSSAQELVVNGGFETGDFTGWTQFGNPGFTDVDGTFLGVDPSEGDFQAYFGPIGSTGGITQTLATTPGGLYNISFDLTNLGGTPNSFSADFGGTNLLSLTNDPGFDYTTLTYQVTATGTSTALTFGFQHDPSFWLLDKVSVQAASAPVPERGTVALLVGMAGAGSLALRRRKKA